MSVMILRDELIAELAYSQTRENLKENDVDFPQVAHMTYLQLTQIIRGAHQIAYPDRFEELRPVATQYTKDDFTPGETSFATPETLEGKGHTYNAARLYLDNVEGETSDFNENIVMLRMVELADKTMSDMIKIKRNEIESLSGARLQSDLAVDQISALTSASPMLFDTEGGMRTLTSRLLIENNSNIRHSGTEVLKAFLAQSQKDFSSGSPLFIPRPYPSSDSIIDEDLKKMFEEVTMSGDKNKISKEGLPDALISIAAATELMNSRVKLMEPRKIFGLDLIEYNEEDKNNLIDALDSVCSSLQIAATLPDRKLSGAEPYLEAKKEYQAYHATTENVYIYSKTPVAEIPKGENRNDFISNMRSHLLGGKLIATTDKKIAEELVSKYSGGFVVEKISPNEMNSLAIINRSNTGRFKSLLSQAMFETDIKTLKSTRDFKGALIAAGLPSTQGVVDAMNQGINKIDGYEMDNNLDASKKMTHYTSSRLSPEKRKEWENALDEKTPDEPTHNPVKIK